MLSTVRCARGSLEALTADPQANFWQGVEAIALCETISGAAPEQGTAVKLAWNAEELRVLFEVTDSHVLATQTKRDGPLWEEEVVEVFLDPIGDLESYFEFEINPLGTVLDLVARRNRSGYAKDFSWDCAGWRTLTQRTPGGWCAELAFPFSSVAGAAPTPGERWRANFCRIDRPPGRERELSAWSPTCRANFHTPERFGFLEFAA